MKCPLVLLLAGCVAATIAACGGSKPVATPTPVANADSVAAAEKARQDSIAAEADRRAREEADRLAREEAERARLRTADSLAALARAAEAVRDTLSTMIGFDYDKANIRPGDAALLDQKVAILAFNPDIRIRIAGHCDERGSDEYNLALGSRRANSAKRYLVNHGVAGDRIETVSYGEEQPLDPGHDEAAWARNRRNEFAIVSGGVAIGQPR